MGTNGSLTPAQIVETLLRAVAGIGWRKHGDVATVCGDNFTVSMGQSGEFTIRKFRTS